VGVPPVIGLITPLTTSAESRGTRTGWLPPNTTVGTKTPATTAITTLIGTTTVVYADTYGPRRDVAQTTQIGFVRVWKRQYGDARPSTSR